MAWPKDKRRGEEADSNSVYTYAPVIKGRTFTEAPRKGAPRIYQARAPCEYLPKDEATSELVKQIPIAGAGDPAEGPAKAPPWQPRPMTVQHYGVLTGRMDVGSQIKQTTAQIRLTSCYRYFNAAGWSGNVFALNGVVPIVTAINQ